MEKSKLNMSNFISFTIDDITKNFNKCIDDIELFIKKYPKIILRTNNETGGNGMHILESNSSKKNIVGVLKLLNTRCSKFFRKRSSTRIMAVEYISTHDPDKLIDLYRVHICLGKIISYYAVTSKLNVFHSIDMNYEDLNRFILINENLPSKISKIESKILLSAKVLGCNVGAVEFFLINDEQFFLSLIQCGVVMLVSWVLVLKSFNHFRKESIIIRKQNTKYLSIHRLSIVL